MKTIKKQWVLNKIKLIYFICIISTYYVNAQHDAQFTQYMYNTNNINPAYAGSRGVLSVYGNYRTQWVGLEGAPTTISASINSPLNESRVGVGLSIIKDIIGPSERNLLSGDISYTIPTSEDYKLSFGIKVTANLFNVDYTKLNRYNLSDPRFQNNINNQFSANIGTGIYYHSDKMYVGISSPYILKTSYFNDNESVVAKEISHYYIMGGYVFDINESLKFKPSFLVKTVKGAPLQLDLTGTFMFYEKFVLGGAWRWDAAISGLAGFQIDNNWFIGYSYDRDTTKLVNYNSGSHEIFLRYEFIGKEESLVSPRFF